MYWNKDSPQIWNTKFCLHRSRYLPEAGQKVESMFWLWQNQFGEIKLQWRKPPLWTHLLNYQWRDMFEGQCHCESPWKVINLTVNSRKNSDSDQLDTIKITVAVTGIKWCGLDHSSSSSSSSRNGFWVLHHYCVWVSQGETVSLRHIQWHIPVTYFGMITKNFSGLSQIKIFRQNFLQFLLTSYYLGSMRF